MTSGEAAPRTPLLTLDVLPFILQHITYCPDLFSLCLASRSFAYYTRRRLYDGTLFVNPAFGSDANDLRRYTKALRVIGDHPDLAQHVRVFVVPYMELPHERYDDLWDRAFSNCKYIREFQWQSVLPIPTTILGGLSSKTNLTTLCIPGDNLSSDRSLTDLGMIGGLDEVTLVAPDRPVGRIFVNWLNGMSESLTRLHIESAVWLEDNHLEQLQLPHLKSLVLHDCPRLTHSGIFPLLCRTAASLEHLYLGLPNVKIAELTKTDLDGNTHTPRPTLILPSLRKISLNWEKSLAFWIHAQNLLENSPIEVFHIIRSESRRSRRGRERGGNGNRRRREDRPPRESISLTDAIFSLSPVVDIFGSSEWNWEHTSHGDGNDTRPPIANAILDFYTLGTTTTLSRRHAPAPSQTNSNLNPADDRTIPVSFLHRFVSLHHKTLRRFYAPRMRCSEEGIREFFVLNDDERRRKCERLERVRVGGVNVDETPMNRSLARTMTADGGVEREEAARSKKWLLSWWWARGWTSLSGDR